MGPVTNLHASFSHCLKNEFRLTSHQSCTSIYQVFLITYYVALKRFMANTLGVYFQLLESVLNVRHETRWATDLEVCIAQIWYDLSNRLVSYPPSKVVDLLIFWSGFRIGHMRGYFVSVIFLKSLALFRRSSTPSSVEAPLLERVAVAAQHRRHHGCHSTRSRSLVSFMT